MALLGRTLEASSSAASCLIDKTFIYLLYLVVRAIPLLITISGGGTEFKHIYRVLL